MNTYLAFLGTIGIVVFALAQWRSGRATGKGLNAQTAADTVALLQSSVNAFKGELAEAKKQIHDSELEIVRLQEANKHKDEQIKAYLEIIANRNPDLEQTLTDVRNFLAVLNQKLGDGAAIVVKSIHD